MRSPWHPRRCRFFAFHFHQMSEGQIHPGAQWYLAFFKQKTPFWWRVLPWGHIHFFFVISELTQSCWMVATQISFIFIPTWGRLPFWLILFRWVETTNQVVLVDSAPSKWKPMLEGIFDRLNLGFCRAPWRKRHGVSSSVNAGGQPTGSSKRLVQKDFFH